MAHPNFYNLNEDTSEGDVLWYLEMDESDVDHPVSTDLKLTSSPSEFRVTFIAGGEVYSLQFPSKEAHVAFYNEFNVKLFENTYGMEHDEDAEAKIFGEDYSSWARGQDGEGADWTDEPLAAEVPHPPPPTHTKSAFSNSLSIFTSSNPDTFQLWNLLPRNTQIHPIQLGYQGGGLVNQPNTLQNRC